MSTASEEPLFAGERPVVLVAFGGWSDAAGAATGAVEYLEIELGSDFARGLDDDDYFDYQLNRPELVGAGDERRLVWPGVTVHTARVGERVVATVLGPEPSFRWRHICAELLPTIIGLDPQGVIVLGCMIGQLPHTRPTVVTMSAPTPLAAANLGVPLSPYRGEVGIQTVFAAACADAGLNVVSLWAMAPNYLSDEYAAASLALLHRIEDLTGLRFPLDALRTTVADEAVSNDQTAAEDDDLRDYVGELEKRYDSTSEPGERMVDDIMRYLREQGE